MNRIGLKQASRMSVAQSQSSPIVTTLIYLLIIYVIDFVAVKAAGVLVPALESSAYLDADTYFYTLISSFFTIGYAVYSLFSLAVNLFTAVFQVGYYNYCLKISRKTDTGISDLFEVISFAGKILWLSLLMSLFTFLWSLLFYVPGIIAFYRYRMAYFALLDNPNLTAREALNVSKQLTKGNKLNLFVMDLSFIGWFMLGVITLGIVLVWKMPYISTTYAHTYNWMVQSQNRGYYDGGTGGYDNYNRQGDSYGGNNNRDDRDRWENNGPDIK